MSRPAVPEALLQASLGQVLFRAARLYNEAALRRVQAGAAPKLRFAHTQLFPHLSTSGIRSSALAKRLGVSKQAVGPLLEDLVDWGMVERVPDPSDRRASMVRLTPRGGEAILHGLTVLGQIEAELRGELGDGEMNRLHDTLSRLTVLLGDRG